jgi:hypothetical protein
VDKIDPRHGRPEGPSVPQSGTLIRRLALGTEAIYRVLGENDRGVEVEVVDAPGLEPGTRFTFTIADVTTMSDVSQGARAGYAVGHGVPEHRYA